MATARSASGALNGPPALNSMTISDHHKSPVGFTVAELLVGIAIVIMIGAAVLAFQKNISSLNNFLSSNLIAQSDARKALKMMTAEIRPLSPSSTGAYPIAEAGTNSFIFYSDIDNDQLKERVRYFMEGTTLKKGVIKPTGEPLAYNPASENIIELAHDITNGLADSITPIFSYYNTGYDGTTPPLNEPVDILAVRLTKITIIMDSNPSRPPGPITLTTQISMRNLKDNL
ncbi:MAG: hypothetical protein UX17_C0067G0002 [Parcubacteria group bacterium GW2011_GWC2_45_7]|nr:MAG: hypothetical protein UX17_C0067G0002 [Parcubacteria group bacterium GW2011_GWC2_45_7]KKU72743.1 MAG: hypothetical protein UX98_C0018G0022 [Parcubacteria group bacterium GW2011_GWA2_47_26]